KIKMEGFPGGAVVESAPADMAVSAHFPACVLRYHFWGVLKLPVRMRIQGPGAASTAQVFSSEVSMGFCLSGLGVLVMATTNSLMESGGTHPLWLHPAGMCPPGLTAVSVPQAFLGFVLYGECQEVLWWGGVFLILGGLTLITRELLTTKKPFHTRAVAPAGCADPRERQ
uniref:EamA domain-containing protein n=1 Tax=Monodon monoceros TaxID=40151 RepID=A0A8C6CBR9_MONMO